MDFIAEMKAFKILQPINRLSPGQRSLWLALFQIANDLHWREWFSVANVTLQSECSLSREGIIKARNVLKQKGYIDYRSNGTNATSYKIISLTMTDSTQDSTQGSTQDSTQGSTQDSTQGCTLLKKQNKTTQNKTVKENKQKKFEPPTVEEVEAYCRERENGIIGQAFVDFYASKGWKVGNNPMEDWKAAVRTWEQRRKPEKEVKRSKFQNFEKTDYDFDEIEKKLQDKRVRGVN